MRPLTFFLFILLPLVFFSCQSEAVLPDPEIKEEPENPLLGRWNIARYAIIIKGGAIMEEDAGYIYLEAEGKGEAMIMYQGSPYADPHPINWSYEESNREVSLDHLDGSPLKIYEVKNLEENSQTWQVQEFDSQGNLESMIEILLEK